VGDYGLPPACSAFAIHAQIVAHYLHGAWLPQGGSSHIARTFETGIERCGGVIRVCQEVTQILAQEGRVIGVKVVDRRGPVPHDVTHLAPFVISNVGAPITFKQFLPTDGEIGRKTAQLRALIDGLQGGMSAVTLYLRLKAPASAIGVSAGNVWINTDTDHDAVEEHGRHMLDGEPGYIYVSFPSAKSGEERFHTAEIISFIDFQAFAAWQAKPTGNRGADYYALKKRIGDGLLRLAETAIPGLTALVEYAELSTPLTVEHYTSHPGGRFYGLPATPERYRSQLLGPRTPIKGLYLSGEDAGCLGIVGAMMGGVSAASQVLGSKSYGMIKAALRKGPETAGTSVLPPEKKRAVLVTKTQLTPTIWRMDFEVEGQIEAFSPGQFARVRVRDWEWRDYSIAGMEGSRVWFLISTQTGGQGSQFVVGAKTGDSTEIELPLGQYTIASNTHRMVFIATGTGLAPFLAMFRQLQMDGALDRCQLLFGCRTIAEDITAHFDVLPATVIRCFSRDETPPGGLHGRVTDALADLTFDAASTDFYVCGSSAMVTDSKLTLGNCSPV
jgi:all-trans-retinol 13,14-reductase